MILDGSEKLVVSSIGWVERGGFIVRDISTGRVTSFPGDDGSYMRLFAIDGERFLTALHAAEADTLQLAVRSFSDPATPLWSLRVTPRSQLVSGDPRATHGIRRHHLATFKNGGRWDHHLVTVEADGSRAALGGLAWYNSESYDLGYQGLTDAVGIPGSELVLVSVQRSSIIVIHNPADGREAGRFELANRHGNPMLTLIDDELWTIDYDTFVRVDLKSRRILQKVLLQEAASGTAQFAGDLFVWRACRKAVIPRPFSGDIAILNVDTGAIERIVALGRQPLSCVVTKTGRVIARDWKTGDWLEGHVPTGGRRWWRFWHS